MITGCIRRGSCLSICFRDENVKTKHDHSILTSQSTLFLCWIKIKQDRRTCAQEFEVIHVSARLGDIKPGRPTPTYVKIWHKLLCRLPYIRLT